MRIGKMAKAALFLAAAGGGAVAIYAGFALLYEAETPGFGRQFIVGCLSALITVAATASLLRAQSRLEFLKEQRTGIFREKLNMHATFVSHLNTVNEDGEVSDEEFDSIIDWATKIALVSHVRTVQTIYEHVFQLRAFDGAKSYEDLDEDQKVNWKSWIESIRTDLTDFENEKNCIFQYASIGTVIHALRLDLSESTDPSDDDQNRMVEVVDRLRALKAASEVVFSDSGYEVQYH